ncbi:MAG: hypothetical protein JST68_25180 [Bacteroidetes bacterium]|nr:hypothetical protein [Bacteroidota bacterium]
MKASLFIACTLFICSSAFSQAKSYFPKPSLSTLPSITIHLHEEDAPAQATTRSSFTHFEVLDQRPDTARIGVHTNKSSVRHPRDRQLVFDKPANTAIESWLNQHFTKSDGPYTALIVLRTLWLSDAKYLKEDLKRYPGLQLERTHIRLKAEVYAGRDGNYMPIFRFDTLFYTIKSVYSIRSPYTDWDEDLAALLANLADSASAIASRKQAGSLSIPLAAIHEFNASRFDPPIDDNAPLTPGVYASFEEFRNNTPSIQNFEIKREGTLHLLYITEPGGSYYSHDAWGYCDGKNIYVMRDGILRLAWKEGKAYYFYTTPVAGSISPGLVAVEYRNRFIYTVDMDTGIIY